MAARSQIIVVVKEETYSVAALGIVRIPDWAVAGQIVRVRVKSDQAMSGGDAVFDVNINGTSIWNADPTQRVKIVNGQTVGQVTGLTAAVAVGDTITFDFDNFTGTATEVGDDLTVTIEIAETGATATDAQLRDRATHTGTQLAASISDLAEAVSDGVANTIEYGSGLEGSFDDPSGILTIQQSWLLGEKARQIIPIEWLSVPAAVAAFISATANRVYVFRFRLSVQAESIAFAISVADASDNILFGLYTGDGNTKIADTGSISMASTGPDNVSFSPVLPDFTRPDDYFYFAWGQTAPVLGSIVAAASAGSGFTDVVNEGITHLGFATNSISGGALPATLGSITASDVNVPLVKLQGA
jgi:hypothetical protein